MDTLRNTNYIFAVLSDSEVKASLKDDVFMIVMYYLNKLLAVRTDSVQKKLTGLFKNNSGCQNLFSKFYQYLKNYQNKINKGMLRSFLSKQKYTDELSPKSFYVDKNLEKQIIEFFRLTCKNGNSFMQNYMKKQYNNSKSFNMVSLVNDFTKEFLTHLNYPVAYDTFNTCLKCILEFIQGPNETNQNIFIINDFVPNVAELILDMDYKNKDYEKDVSNDPADRFNVSNNSITVKSQRPLQSSISVGKSGFKRVSEQNVARPSTNYMISLSKFRVLSILNHLLDGFEATDYVYYLYRRVLSPAIFRKNFAYQQYFFSKSCGAEYDTNLFFKFYQNFDKKNKSPFVIEIGFECYFLLKKMEDNFKVDFDETYHKKIMALMPKWDKPQIKTNHNIFIESANFVIDLFKSFTSCCFNRNQEVVMSNVKKMMVNDNTIRSILLFYENNSAQIEILKDGEMQEYWFPRLPYCSFRHTDTKDEFLFNVNRTNPKTK